MFALIDASTESRSYREGDELFSGGKICRELFFVCSGVLRIMVINEQGNQVIHFFIKENQFCSILNSFNNRVTAQGKHTGCQRCGSTGIEPQKFRPALYSDPLFTGAHYPHNPSKPA